MLNSQRKKTAVRCPDGSKAGAVKWMQLTCQTVTQLFLSLYGLSKATDNE